MFLNNSYAGFLTKRQGFYSLLPNAVRRFVSLYRCILPAEKKTLGKICSWGSCALERKFDSSVLTGSYYSNDVHHQQQTMKPPNVLVQTDSDSRYAVWNKLLAEVLYEDQYTIYQLPLSKLLSTPWVDNCMLLIIDRENEILKMGVEVVQKYIASNGKVLSFSPLNADIKCEDVKYRAEVSSCEHSLIKPFVGTLQRWMKKDEEIILEETNKEGNLEEETNKECNLKEETNKENSSEETSVEDSLSAMSLAEHEISVEENSALFEESISRSKVIWFEAEEAIIFSRVHILSLYNSINVDSRVSAVMLGRYLLQHLSLKCQDAKVHTETMKANILKPAVLLGDPEDVLLCVKKFKSISGDPVIPGSNFTIEFVERDLKDTVSTEDYLPVITSGSPPNFDYETYLSALKTRQIGKVLMYSDVVTSTQEIFEKNSLFNLNAPYGLVITAKHQTKGQGRGGNVWLSPVGCMMFSMAINIPIHSNLGQKLPFLQHIAAVAVARGVRCYEGYKNLPINLKWPNDIYYGSKSKLGGVLVKSVYYKDHFNVIVGIGVNVANERPTVCVNRVIEEYNMTHGTRMKPLKLELLLARTLSQFELLIDLFQEHGAESFCPLYYSYWIHKNQNVRMESEGGEEVVLVNGLDDYGFLQVKQENGNLLSLQPDGNTFDMMQNLIRSK